MLSTHPLLFDQLLSSYQTYVIVSPIPIYSLFYAIYAPYKCTCTKHQTIQISLSSYLAHTLCTKTPFPTQQASLAIVPFWYGGSRHGWGFLLEQPNTLVPLLVLIFINALADELTCSLFVLRWRRQARRPKKSATRATVINTTSVHLVLSMGFSVKRK